MIGRTRRQVGESAREVVEYRVLAGADVVVVSEWEPAEYAPIGTRVKLPVTIRPFVSRAGAAGYRLTRREPSASDF